MNDEKYNENEEYLKECQCCNYSGLPLKSYRNKFAYEENMIFCEICASTFIGNIYQYPHYDSGVKLLGRSLGWVVNKILDEIRSLK